MKTADTIEVLAGDLLHRLRLTLKDRADALGPEAVESAKKLAEHLRALEARGPLGADWEHKLIEAQGERIQQLERTRRERERRIQTQANDFEAICAEREALKNELARLRAAAGAAEAMRHERAELRADVKRLEDEVHDLKRALREAAANGAPA